MTNTPEYQREYNSLRMLEGKCLRCPRPAQAGKVHCFSCARKMAQRVLERYHRRKRELRSA